VTPRTQLLLALAALAAFTGLTITMIYLGQPANAIASLILAIVLGVTQLAQALVGGMRDRGSHRLRPLVLTERTAPGPMAADNTDISRGDGGDPAAAGANERPAA
jgi:hypothetical protein